MLLLGATLGAVVLGAHAHRPTVPLTPGHVTGHVHHQRSASWPPQPEGAQNVRDESDPGDGARRREARDARFREVEARIANDAALQPLRGRRMQRLTVVEPDVKDDAGTVRREAYFFDRAANVTRKVTEHHDGRVSASAIPAAEYQPEITDEETDEAVQIARRFFQDQGDAGVTALQGFGIQAYKPTGTGFYDGRVVYVSFHVDNDSDPRYQAWVDLSAGRVIKSRKE